MTANKHGSKFFDVARFRMTGDAREEFEKMRDATDESESVVVVTEPGVAYRVMPAELNSPHRTQEDQLSVWGISDHEHPRTGYMRFKALGDAELATVPLRTLGRLAIRRVAALIRSVSE